MCISLLIYYTFCFVCLFLGGVAGPKLPNMTKGFFSFFGRCENKNYLPIRKPTPPHILREITEKLS